MAIEFEEVDAAPNKVFFVSMLTRDIDLQDALLDLLDNCVDGVQRTNKGRTVRKSQPYSGYYAQLVLKPNVFKISDNCGGIPSGDARNRAFMMGRPRDQDDGLATVGRYGIGMKRAIFKITNSATVISKSGAEAYKISISRDWMNSPGNWRLPMKRIARPIVKTDGVRIKSFDLREEISRRFDEKESNFISEFRIYVARHYSIILSKGFRVTVNGIDVAPSAFQLFTKRVSEDKVAGLEPFALNTRVGSVDVEIYAGLFRRIPTDEELDREGEARTTRDESGWSIACNDRVVLYRDKTHLTGWGTGGVPNWHGQFMAFGGIVLMRSLDVTALPLTTTKRGIDVSSKLYSVILDYMREATKTFTGFTNKWKKAGDELTDEIYGKTETVGLNVLRARTQLLSTTQLRKFGVSVTAHINRPDLPVPKNANRNVRISYEKAREEVLELAELLFENKAVQAKVVGEAAFDRTLKSFKRR